MAESTIAVRSYVEADLGGVLDLLRVSLGESAILERTPELFTWKHSENPFGRSILLVAEADHRIVGLRAFMRWELATRDGETLRCVRAVDTATHPEYQRRGIFRRLTLAALEQATVDGVDMVFNTPNPKSGAGYLSMGWIEVGDIGVMVAPGRGVLRRGVLRRTVADDRLPEPTDFLRTVVAADGLETSDRAPRGLRTRRSPAYLAWRFSGHPTARYFRIDASGSTAIVRPNVRNGRRELVLSDVFGPHLGRAIGATRHHNRAAYLAGWFSSGSPERSAALRRGMLPVPRMKTLTLVAKPLRALRFDVGTLDAWDLASSDLELL